jgi:hypothetical protein
MLAIGRASFCHAIKAGGFSKRKVPTTHLVALAGVGLVGEKEAAIDCIALDGPLAYDPEST